MYGVFKLCDSLLGVIGRICHYSKVEDSLYPIGALYYNTICAALDKVFVH
jgi:hypothetical protein